MSPLQEHTVAAEDVQEHDRNSQTLTLKANSARQQPVSQPLLKNRESFEEKLQETTQMPVLKMELNCFPSLDSTYA